VTTREKESPVSFQLQKTSCKRKLEGRYEVLATEEKKKGAEPEKK